ncbi:MAG: hypothetical protein H7098_12360 [Oligoflexus sp.]|nr:hypothetical protein [Pseudopedobacter sp.]
MRKLILSTFTLICFAITVSAQSNYKTGVGIRGGGYENGLTIKHFTNSNTAIEGILGFRPGVVVVTGLYEKHAVAFSEPSVNWFYGAGAHIGAIDGDRYYRGYGKNRYYRDNGLLLGADGILGLEWKIPEIPFALSGDLHPRLELARGPFLDLEAAATLRFTF